jgi:hypothetical protein
MHRWIVDNPYGDDGEPDVTGHNCSIATTIIANYLPGQYRAVRTWRDDGTSIAARLITALRTRVDLKEVQPRVTFITQVTRCDKYGINKERTDKNGLTFAKPLFEREYATLEEAKSGHKEAVAQFS